MFNSKTRREILSSISYAAIASLSPANAGTMLLLGAGASGGLPGVGPIPTPTAVLASSRLQLPNLASTSNGTNTGSNSRIAMYNETGATITKVKVFWVNWNSVNSGSNEANATSTINITASVEFPAGTFNQAFWSTVGNVNLSPSGLAVNCDEITLSTPITPGAIFWVRTYVTVISGQKWPIVYQGLNTAANMSEGADLGTSTVDETLSGTITGNNACYGPSAVLATGWTGTAVKFGVIGLGDSIINGATDAADSQNIGHGNVGFLGKACAWPTSVPYCDFAVTGSSAQFQTGSNFTKRADLISRLGTTVIVVENWATNDFSSNRTLAQVKADVGNIVAQLTALPNVRVVGLPVIPRTNCSHSIISLTSVGTTATATIDDTSNLQTGQKVVIAGATPSAYNTGVNGTQITVIDGQTFTYQFAGGTSPATGTITVNDRWESTAWQTPINSNFAAGASSSRGQWNALMRSGQLPGFRDIIEISDPVETFRNSSFWTNSGVAPPNTHLPKPNLLGTVSSGVSTTVFNSNATTTYTSFYFGGWIVWLTGANAGVVRSVSSNTIAGQYTQSVALANQPVNGETFMVWPSTRSPTSDGIHPFADVQALTANQSSGQTGIYVCRDVAIPKIAAWLLL